VSILAQLAFVAPASAQGADDLRFSVTPYIWLPTVEGDFRFDSPPGFAGSPDIKIGPVDYLENLQGVFMIAGEARYGRLGAFTDFIWLDFENEDGEVRQVTGPGPIETPIDIGTQTSLSGTLWTIAGGYDVKDEPDMRVQVFAGARNLNAEASADWLLSGPLDQFPQSGEVSEDVDAWDGLIGVRGSVGVDAWVFPYYADIGAGSSDLTWQAMVGVGYQFGWGDIGAYYRTLHYEQDESELIQELEFSGPALGATFRF
jgi:hypothetical protein